jgi:hypothetical protein
VGWGGRRRWGERRAGQTFFFVHAQHDDDFVAANPDEFLYGSDTATGELREQDHALDIVIFELHNRVTSVNAKRVEGVL